MTRQRSEFLATFRTEFLTGRTGTVALAIATSVVTLSVTIMGCAPSGRTGSKGEVVEIETIETIPAADQAQKNARAVAIDEEAAQSKKTVDAATAAADLAIAEAGKTIDAKAEAAPAARA